MIGTIRSHALSLLAGGAILAAAYALRAQQPAAQQDEYISHSAVTAPGLAPKMRVKELAKTSRTFEVVFGKGDEVASGLTEFAEKNHITAAHFTAIGAMDSVVLGWTDPAKKAFKKIPIDQEAELVSFIGNITSQNGKPTVHAHAVFALSDGSTRAGHFVEGRVSLIMQVFVVDSDPIDGAKTDAPPRP